MLFRSSSLTPAAILKMNEGKVKMHLAEKLTNYCGQRILSLLHDIGRQEWAKEQEKQDIIKKVGASIREKIETLQVKDAREMLIELTGNDRFAQSSPARSVMIWLLQETMQDLSIYWVRYNQKTWQRELIVENKEKK